jgi:uncharacterized membrane protein
MGPTTIKWAALAAALLFVFASGGGPARGAPKEEARRLLVSIYDNEAAAAEALRSLKAARDRGAVAVDSYALVAKEPNGKVKLRERRAKGTRPGQAVAAIGGVLGVQTGTGLGSNTAAATEYLTSNVVGMQKELVASLRDTLPPGGAALVAAVGQKHADAAAQVQEVGATRVLTYDLPATLEVDEDARAVGQPMPKAVVVPGSP